MKFKYKANNWNTNAHTFRVALIIVSLIPNEYDVKILISVFKVLFS